LYKTTGDQQLVFSNPIESLLWNEYAVRKDQKTAIMNTLIKLACTNQSLVKLQDFLAGKYSKDDVELSAEQQTELALQLALKIPDKSKKILDNQENRISSPDKKAEFLFVRQSVQPEKDNRDRFFKQLLKAQNREHEPWVDRSMAFLNHPYRQKESLEYIRPALEALIEIQQTGDIFFPKSWLDSLLKGHSSSDVGTIVKQFLTDHPNYPENLKMKILQSADHLLRIVK